MPASSAETFWCLPLSTLCEQVGGAAGGLASTEATERLKRFGPNLLYDLSEIGIPFDRVDDQDLAEPQAWDMGGILRFTLIMGALSSLFDLATFAMLAWFFDAGPDVFRTAWFVESTATQILVIFIIRTHGLPWSSRVNPLLIASSLGALSAAFAIVATPLGGSFGFVSVPITLLAATSVVVIGYLIAAEITKTVAIRSR